jgi:hypothetical protein
VRRIVGNFSCRFATKGVRKTVRYNDSMDANRRVTYCIIHELLLEGVGFVFLFRV